MNSTLGGRRACPANSRIYSGLKGQYTLAQPSGLGKEAIALCFALKGQNKALRLCCSFGVHREREHKPQGVALGYITLHFQCAAKVGRTLLPTLFAGRITYLKHRGLSYVNSQTYLKHRGLSYVKTWPKRPCFGLFQVKNYLTPFRYP